MKESWCYYDLKEAQLHNAAYLHIPFTTSCSNAASVHFWVMHFFRATLMLHEFENIICSKVSLFRLLNVQLYIHTSTNTNTQHISKYKYTGLWNAWPAAAAHCVAIWTPPPPSPPLPPPHPPHHSLCSVELCQIKMAFPTRDILTVTIITVMGEAAIWTQDRGKRRDWAGQDSNLFSAFCLRRQVRRWSWRLSNLIKIRS